MVALHIERMMEWLLKGSPPSQKGREFIRVEKINDPIAATPRFQEQGPKQHPEHGLAEQVACSRDEGQADAARWDHPDW